MHGWDAHKAWANEVCSGAGKTYGQFSKLGSLVVSQLLTPEPGSQDSSNAESNTENLNTQNPQPYP